MDIGRLYGRYLPLTPGQTPVARSDSGRKFFGGENLTINRTNAYASSGRPKLTDDEIDALAVKYDFQNMTREDYDDFLDDLVDKGVLTRAETAYFGYGGTVRLDAADSKIMVVSVAGQERSYGQNTPFLRGQQSLINSSNKYNRKLKSLRLMNRHKLDGIRIMLFLL